MNTVYDFEALQINGKAVPLRKFKGKVMLIVNTASACGFTPQTNRRRLQPISFHLHP